MRLRALPLALALLPAALPLTASADAPLITAVSSNDIQDPSVAYNSTADQYLAVYTNAFGNIEGLIVDADGTELDWVPIATGDFTNPRVTYREGSDDYVVVARSVEPLGERIIVRFLDADGTGFQTRTTALAGAVETPDVLDDTFPGCCTLVTWKQYSGATLGQRYDSAGNPMGGVINIVPDAGTTGSRSYHARIAYQQPSRDDFAVFWMLARNNQPGLIQARVVEPLTGALGPIQTLTTTAARPWARLGERFPGGLDVAYDDVGDRYYVAWRDDEALMLRRTHGDLLGGFDSIVLQQTPSGYQIHAGSPEVVVAPGFGKAYVTHPVHLDGIFGPGQPGYFVHGWWFTATGTFGPSPLSTWWNEESLDNVAAGFSPVTDTVLGVFERDRNVSPPGLDDLWYALEDRP